MIKKRLIKSIRQQQGFTLTELLAVMAILGILAGLVSGAVGGVGSSGQKARLSGDRVTIGTAVDRFFNLSFPQSYPIQRFEDTDPSLRLAGDLGVRVIDYDARLPQDPDQTFTPNFLKEIPDSAAFVSWRIDTARGILFYAQEGAQLILPAQSRLNVSATDSTSPGAVSGYSFNLRMKKNEASVTGLTVEIPAGYEIGGQSLDAGTTVGVVSGHFTGDNPWDSGHSVPFSGSMTASGVPNEYNLTIDYPDTVNAPADAAVPARPDKTHTITILEPSEEVPGKLTIKIDRTGESSQQNYADEYWQIDVLGTVPGPSGAVSLITNPSSVGVYRWLGAEITSIDIVDTYDSVPGRQGVIIK